MRKEAYEHWIYEMLEPCSKPDASGDLPQPIKKEPFEFDAEREREFKMTDEEKNILNDEYLKKFGL